MNIMIVLIVFMSVADMADMTDKFCMYSGQSGLERKICSKPKCFKPKFTDYVGLAERIGFGCGECTEESCEFCEATASAVPCNKIEVGNSFNCYKHEWDGVMNTWKYGDQTTCHRRKETKDVKCNWPKGKPGQTDYKNDNKGCGPCEDGANCQECKTAQCNKPSNTFECFKYTMSVKQWRKGGKIDCKISTDALTCNAPVVSASGTAYGCGPCPKELGKTCFECTTSGCNEEDAEYKCYQYTWDGGNSDWKKQGAQKTCKRFVKGLEALCNMPTSDAIKEGDYTSDGCGECESADKCLPCKGDSCNAQVVTVVKFECHAYEFKGEKFVVKKNKVKCTKKKTDEAKCNKPEEDAKESDWSGDGCGECKSTDSKCKDCKGASCNGAVTIIAYVVPLLAMMYALL